MSYYSDLSADSSGEEGIDESEEEDLLPKSNKNGFKSPDEDQQQSSFPLEHCILHVDIDCFYCQCEHIDRKLPESRPLAIGQKHIIVTSNYAARKLGVKKLQGREDAKKVCPGLLIVEGSDLERYRRHGRKVYDAFRECVQKSFQSPEGKIPAVRKGRGMDEMQADLTCLVDVFEDQSPSLNISKENEEKPVYIYGEQRESATLTEDQTGVEAVVGPYDMSLDNKKTHFISGNSRSHCQQRLLLAARNLGTAIQQFIFDRTGFTTTLGISVNPLLAKLASDLQKPSSVNVLFPWRSAQLIAPMPLRKIPDAGHKTIKSLKPALEKFHGARDAQAFWTCGDLLGLPKSEVRRCLNSEAKCTMILQRCQGIDTTQIVDDQGEAPKTISCENSFRRGTVVTPSSVWKGMGDLYTRLPRLLKDRREWSKQPSKAYPTTIRLTARVVDGNLQNSGMRRRPFVTRSKQVPFRGRELMEDTKEERQRKLVQDAVSPLVQSLVLHSPDPGGLNVTRLNIAVTNFQDIGEAIGSLQTQKKPETSQLVAAFATQSASQISQSTQPKSPYSQSIKPVRQTSASSFTKRNAMENHQSTGPDASAKKPKTVQSTSTTTRSRHKATVVPGGLPSGIDPATLAELPPNMVQQIVRDYKDVVRSKATKTSHKAKSTRIDQFFKRK